MSNRKPPQSGASRRMVTWSIMLGLLVLVIGFVLNPSMLSSLWAQSDGRAAGSRSRSTDPLIHFNLDNLVVPRDQILSGGPRKDGIPSLTNPKTAALQDVSYAPDDRMVVVEVDGQTRSYPIKLLNWHEVINDRLGDTPIATIYCPLCDSVSVVERRMNGQTLEFGISGLLHNSNVLLYDRTDDALWSQIGLEAISGPHVGKSLKHLPWQLTSFAQLKQTHPDAAVVTKETGHRRDYSRNPYASYFATDRLMFPVKNKDPRLEPKQRIVGVRLGEQAYAYPLKAIEQAPGRTIREQFNDAHLVLKMDDAGHVSIVQAPDDAQVVHTFWFTWAAFHPQTTVYGQKPSDKADR